MTGPNYIGNEIIISSSALPTGAATAANQTTTNTTLSTMNTRDASATDSTTGARKTITYAHNEIHSGDAYFVSRAVIVDDGSDDEIRIQTPDTAKWAHMEVLVYGTGETDVDLYRGTSKTHVVGNAITPINRNENSSNTSGLTICHTPAGSGDGSLISEAIFGLDTGQGATLRISGGGTESRSELILKQNTAYLLRIASGTDGNRITVVLDYYEHTNS